MDAGLGSANEYQYLAYKDECVAINFKPVVYMNETFEGKFGKYFGYFI